MPQPTDYTAISPNPSAALNGTNTLLNSLELVVVNARAGAYTLAASDLNKAVEVSAAAAVDVTLPLNSVVPIPVGFVSEIMWGPAGAGQVSVVAGQVSVVAASGVGLTAPRGAKIAVQGGSATVRKRGTDSWVVNGDVTT